MIVTVKLIAGAALIGTLATAASPWFGSAPRPSDSLNQVAMNSQDEAASDPLQPMHSWPAAHPPACTGACDWSVLHQTR